MAASVSVSGIGAVSPAGIGLAPLVGAVLAGRSLAAPDPTLRSCPVTVACRVPEFDPKALGVRRPALLDRYTQLALVAADEAMAAAGHSVTDRENARIAVVLGSGAGGTATFERQTLALAAGGADDLSPMVLPAGLLNMAAGQVAIRFGAMGPCLAPCTACASGATAIGLAKQLLERDEADVVLAGGAEAPVTPLYVAAFARMGALSPGARPPVEVCRPFDRARDGFVIGEGAGILVLERRDDILARGARPVADVAGYGASADASHVTAPHPQGRGAELAIGRALQDAGLAPGDVAYLNAHGTSTPVNDAVEARAVLAALGEGMPVSSTKGVLGHALGAASALEAIIAAVCTRDGWIPPTANLVDPDDACAGLDLVVGRPRRRPVAAAMSTSFGFGGQNAALLFTAA
ncbi:MAG TPA: beta-ketoacyl-[acyl-carrier-protein] synthase family protein [Kineosporiaceae bacterium]